MVYGAIKYSKPKIFFKTCSLISKSFLPEPLGRFSKIFCKTSTKNVPVPVAKSSTVTLFRSARPSFILKDFFRISSIERTIKFTTGGGV